MSETKHRHSTHLHDCFIKWDGHVGEVVAESPEGEIRTWSAESNKDGKAITKAIAWCRAGCPPDEPEAPQEEE